MSFALMVMSDIGERGDSIKRMNFARFGLLCLAALLTTVMWAGLLYGASWLFGFPMEPVLFARILGAIFVVMLLGLGLFATSGSEERRGDEHSDGGES